MARDGEPSSPAEEGAPPVRDEAEPTGWPDEAAETAFLAETRDRGEAPSSVKVREETVAETGAGPLPALEELVQQIPADVRSALDDLFRARFVRVTRVPRNALKR